MTQTEKTSAILDGLDFANHDPQNLLNCFFVASAEAEILAHKIDTILRAVGPQEFDVPVEYYRGRLDALSAAIDIVDPEP